MAGGVQKACGSGVDAAGTGTSRRRALTRFAWHRPCSADSFDVSYSTTISAGIRAEIARVFVVAEPPPGGRSTPAWRADRPSDPWEISVTVGFDTGAGHSTFRWHRAARDGDDLLRVWEAAIRERPLAAAANSGGGRGVRIGCPAGFRAEQSLDRRLCRMGDRQQLAGTRQEPHQLACRKAAIRRQPISKKDNGSLNSMSWPYAITSIPSPN